MKYSATLRSYWPLIGLLVLTACERKPGQVGIADTILGGTQTITTISDYTDIYVLMGQSNMAGQHSTDVLSNFVGNPGDGLGPYIAQDIHNPKALYIQCAVGGTYLVRWLPEGDLYGRCMSMIPDVNKVRGVFFMQGEADASKQDPGQADARIDDWANQFTRMIGALRLQLGKPNLPVVFAQIGNTTRGFLYWDHVKTEQANVSVPNVTMIVTDDQAVFDGEHFTQDGYQTIAYRMVRAFNNLCH